MPKFVRNLEKIYDYIFGDLFAPNAADKILEKVDKEIERLENSPFIHVKIGKVNDLILEYRKIIIKNYIVLYTIDEEKEEIYVTHIFCSKSNYMSKI